MKVLVLGGSGATGKKVLMQLIKRGINIKTVIRKSSVLPEKISNYEKLEIIRGSIDEFNSEEIKNLIKDCDAVVSCLGHNVSFKGIYGAPYKLVANTVIKICEAITSEQSNIKFILMSTTAYTNKKTNEKIEFIEKLVTSILWFVLPPHKDNMLAADYLVKTMGNHSNVNWLAVRPDGLIDEEEVSEYTLHEQKLRNVITNPGKTSKINVAHFMAELLTNDNLWNEWKQKTPVIYNKEKER